MPSNKPSAAGAAEIFRIWSWVGAIFYMEVDVYMQRLGVRLGNYFNLPPGSQPGLKTEKGEERLVDLKDQKKGWGDWISRGRSKKDASRAAAAKFIELIGEEHGGVAQRYAKEELAARMEKVKKGRYDAIAKSAAFIGEIEKQYGVVAANYAASELEGSSGRGHRGKDPIEGVRKRVDGFVKRSGDYDHADLSALLEEKIEFVVGLGEEYGSKGGELAEKLLNRELRYNLPLTREKAIFVREQVHRAWRSEVGLAKLKAQGINLNSASSFVTEKDFEAYINKPFVGKKEYASLEEETVDIDAAVNRFINALNSVNVLEESVVRERKDNPSTGARARTFASRSQITVTDFEGEKKAEIPTVQQFVCGVEGLERTTNRLQNYLNEGSLDPIEDVATDPRFNETRVDVLRGGGKGCKFLNYEIVPPRAEPVEGEKEPDHPERAAMEGIRGELWKHYAKSHGIDPDRVFCDIARILKQHTAAQTNAQDDGAYIGAAFGISEDPPAKRWWQGSSVTPWTVMPDPRDPDSLMITFKGTAPARRVTLLSGLYELPPGSQESASFTLRYTPSREPMAHGAVEMLESSMMLDLRPS